METKKSSYRNLMEKSHAESSSQAISATSIDFKLRRAFEARAKLDQDKLKKLKEKRQKEEERKKNAAEIAATRRKKEEMDRIEREEKRKRFTERQQKELERKAMVEEEKKKRCIEKEKEAAERRRQMKKDAKSSKSASKNVESSSHAGTSVTGVDFKLRRAFESKTKLEQDKLRKLNEKRQKEEERKKNAAIKRKKEEMERKDREEKRKQFEEYERKRKAMEEEAKKQRRIQKHKEAAERRRRMKEVSIMPTSCAKGTHETEGKSMLGINANSYQSSESEAYEISPYEEEGSDEEEGLDEEKDDDGVALRKLNPPWARKENLIPRIISQQYVDPDEIFTGARTCNLNEVFESNDSNRMQDFKRRSYSGEWLNDCFTWEEEYLYKLQMGYIN